MSITDELREWGRATLMPSLLVRMEAIADRIDAEHQKALDEWKAKNGDEWLKGYGECRAQLMEGNEIIAEDLEKAGWVRLPVDADGAPIRIGDVMEPKGSDFLFGETSFEVRSMRCDECGWEVYDRLGDRYAPSLLRHHHAQTVEDVLREFAYGLGVPVADSYVAATAAKLRLAEGEDA